jgi:tRNA 2-thiouridine synthesizing protein E
MTDINAIISSGDPSGDPERAVRALEMGTFSREKAIEAARAEGLELSDLHFKVIAFLQDHYVRRGQSQRARVLAAALSAHFAAEGGTKLLYELFPNGPVTQGGRLAGVPVPADSKDASFGTTF